MTAVESRPMQQHWRDPAPTPPGVWLGLLAAPLAWSVQLGVGWWISGGTCADGTPEWGPLGAGAVRVIQVLVAVAALAAATAGLSCAWGAWRRYSPETARLTAMQGEQRIGFMAGAGVLVSGLFTFAIVLTGIGVATVSVCEFMR
jgi:hypothetical protein